MNKNKFTLITTFSVIGVFGFTILSLLYTDNIPLPLILGVAVLLECFFVVPKTVIGYFKLHEENVNSKWLCFMPIFNYSMIMNPVIAILYFVSFIMFLLCLVFLYVPQVSLVLGEQFALGFQDIIPNITIIVFSAWCLITGVGLYISTKTVLDTYNKAFPNSEEGRFYKIIGFIYRYIPVLYIVLFALPVIRVVALLFNLEKLESLTMLDLSVYNVSEE